MNDTLKDHLFVAAVCLALGLCIPVGLSFVFWDIVHGALWRLGFLASAIIYLACVITSSLIDLK